LIDNGTCALHAATRLALDLPTGGGAGRRAHAHPASVAEAFWRLAYGEDGAPVTALTDTGREGAVDFLVDLVREVERRLLGGSAESPAVLARRVVDQAVPADALERESLCAQLGIPTVELAPERLSFLAWDLCVSLTENLRPIVAACRPDVVAPATEVTVDVPDAEPVMPSPPPPPPATDVVVERETPFLPAASEPDVPESRWLYALAAALTIAVVVSRRRSRRRVR
jgi:hypothetical protein